MISAALAEKYQLPVNSIVQHLPAKKMFLYNFVASGIEHEKEVYANAAHPSLQKNQELGLTPTGNIYKIALMYTHINSTPEQYGIIAISIEQTLLVYRS